MQNYATSIQRTLLSILKLIEDIANVIEKRFNRLSYEVKRPFPAGKNKEVIGLTKYELGGDDKQILT